MNFPIEVNLDITQDDFIAVDILEQAADIPLAKKYALNTFIRESAVIICGLIRTLVFKNILAFELIYFLLGFEALFAANFFFNYFKNIDREFSMNVSRLLGNRDGKTIYTPETGFAVFYEDRAEYLTNEQRRYFSYSDIQHIKITRHLFIFIMKRSKEKGLTGFVWMVLPKRNLTPRQEEDFTQLCRQINREYNLSPWTDCRLFD